MDDETGTICELRGEIVFEWRIEKFFFLSGECEKCYRSPKFYFSGTSWQIWIYPNGQAYTKSEKWVSLYLHRMSSGSPVTLDFSFKLKTVDGEIYVEKECERDDFYKNYSLIGVSNIISRLELIEKKCQLAASNDLIVICTLKNCESNAVSGSLFHRHEKISDTLREIYRKEKSWDLQLKVKGGSIHAHQIILETRSPVFHAMFHQYPRKIENGVVSVKDVDFSTMDKLLLLMYSGDMEMLTCENALSLYAAAVKFDIMDVKDMCSEFIMRHLSVENILDVIKLANSYQDEAIHRRCVEYFKENADKILETDNWKTFAEENHGISVELLATTVKTLFKK